MFIDNNNSCYLQDTFVEVLMHVMVIQVAHYHVKLKESAIWLVLYHGEIDVRPKINPAFIHESNRL